MVRILKLALWNLKLWFIVYNEHYALVGIEIWSILDDDDDDDDDDEVFIEKIRLSRSESKIMNNRENLFSTWYKKW